RRTSTATCSRSSPVSSTCSSCSTRTTSRRGESDQPCSADDAVCAVRVDGLRDADAGRSAGAAAARRADVRRLSARGPRARLDPLRVSSLMTTLRGFRLKPEATWFKYWGPVVFYMAVIFFVSSLHSPPLPPGVGDKPAHSTGYLGLGVVVVRALTRGLPAR